MRWLLVTAVLLIVVGLVGLTIVNYYVFEPNRPGITRMPSRGPGGPFREPNRRFDANEFSSNGEQIFLTGTSSRNAISATGGPRWFQMHGGGCATCHGPDGRGGSVSMMGTRFNAPNITYRVLTGEVEGGEEEHAPFTDELIKRAITQGLEPDGERLSENMPRWRMSEQDLNDVINHLKTLEP